MEADAMALLSGSEIHGFHTSADLNIVKLMEDASTRWFRPNEVHAMLSNYACFKIQPQPIDKPPSGSVLLFDRKMLRNFRKDGHNWKKKKDGKTVQEAHEKLKIGNEERIHVYYARCEDDPNFFRRCYWLLDKNLERFVLVHYRQTSEDNLSQLPAPVKPAVDFSAKIGQIHGSPSTSFSSHSDNSGSAVVYEEINSTGDTGISAEDAEFRNSELLHDINTLDWADLVASPNFINQPMYMDGNSLPTGERIQNGMSSFNHDNCLPSDAEVELGSPDRSSGSVLAVDLNRTNHTNGTYSQTAQDQDFLALLSEEIDANSKTAGFKADAVAGHSGNDVIAEIGFLSQESVGKWNCTNDDSFTLDDMQLQAPISNDENLKCQSAPKDHIFDINDISPGWAYATDATKILVVGNFCDSSKNLVSSNIYCVIGEICVAAEVIQPGVLRFTAVPQPPGKVDLFLTLDGRTPISQVVSFDFRSSPVEKLDPDVSLPEGDSKELKWDDHEIRARLAHLLFKSTRSISMLSSKVSPKYLKEAKRFQLLTSPLLEKDWLKIQKLVTKHEASSLPNSDFLLELVLQNKLQEWLLERIADGCKTTPRDSQGQGVIHLCAMLDYAWAVNLFSMSGLSLDFRDVHGWTALHWAAHYGREKMVAALLSAGANPSLVSDPTPEFSGGCIAADLASIQGHEGLAAYLAEKGLTAHFEAMSLSGNASARKKFSSNTAVDQTYDENLSEQELCLKESLAAYRNAADAADRIQEAFRERALKLRSKAVELAEPEPEAAEIIAAMKIQHAFRNFNSRKKLMKAAARIQSNFRTWKTRREFLHTRKQVIKVQAAFRGYQARKHYKKIIWSVGVLEKAILRWRLKLKGLRGMQSDVTEAMKVDTVAENTGEEEFYRISREQAEERVQRSVVRVQAMFRSYRAQQEYRRMKLTYEQAKVEFSSLEQ